MQKASRAIWVAEEWLPMTPRSASVLAYILFIGYEDIDNNEFMTTCRSSIMSMR